jgi:DNA-binding NarL/FixJ family response regulator
VIRVVLADDQELMREGLALILDAQDDLEVVGQAGDGVQAVREVARLRPDVVLMDVRMPVLDGLAATRRIVASGLPTRVLVLTTYDVDDYVYDALTAGASGFLLKEAPRRSLVQAVRTVCAGDVLIAAEPTRRLIESVQSHRPAPPSPRLSTLTAREAQVLTAVARGLSNAEISAELFVSEATVKTHVARLLSKLGQRDRVQLVVYAYENGVVTPG